MPIATINPATGETIATFEALKAPEVEARIARAVAAFEINRRRSVGDRSLRMERAAEILDERAGEYGRLITTEMGKPVTAAVAEVRKCALVCRYYAENAARFIADEHVATDADESYIRYEPMGAILAIMPWNFPFWQVFRFAAPALMAGNVCLLKHASNVPQSALAIETVFRDAGFDQDEFQTLLIGSDKIAALLGDDRIKAATLTGSEGAGVSVATAAAKHIKKTVLELGGSDPFIVMPSANLDEAVTTAVKSRVINNGQSCIAAKRFIVHESVATEFERRFVSAMSALRLGDPMDEATEVGPLATPQILDELDEQVQKSIRAGARLLTGGRRVGDQGNFYAPTVLSEIPADAPVRLEETFGPVASLYRVRDFDEAVTIANSTTFGLGASVWTSDQAEARRFAEEIESGQVFVNAMVASDPRLPFGGVKRSGFGRELGEHGIREFVNVKTVYIVSSPA